MKRAAVDNSSVIGMSSLYWTFFNNQTLKHNHKNVSYIFFMYSHKAPYEKTCITQIFYLINFVGLIKGQKLYKRIPLNCIKYVIEEYLLIYRHPLGLAQKICKGLKLVTT